MTTFVSTKSLYAIAGTICAVFAILLFAIIGLVAQTKTICDKIDNDISQIPFAEKPQSLVYTATTLTGTTKKALTVHTSATPTSEQPRGTQPSLCAPAELGVPECPVRAGSTDPDLDRAVCVLDSYPLIDGHNDLADRFRMYADNQVYSVDLKHDTRLIWDSIKAQTDIPRLRAGKLGAQFWACYVECAGQYKDAVRMTLDQLDVIKKIVTRYPDTFKFVTSAKGILEAFSERKIGSLIGLEGGHSIDSSLGILRMYYQLGVRYMTVTHSCNTPWADNWHVDQPQYNGTKVNGLTDFGKSVIREMNRLGMMVDLAHVAKKTMLDVLAISQAPVIFSHSSAFQKCHHYRNVQNDVLLKTRDNGGIVMVNFYDKFITCHPSNKTEATLTDAADHIDYIKTEIGVDHVGIGADFGGIPTVTKGLEDVSRFPYLFAELVKRGWTNEELQKLAGRNLIRVFTAVEKKRDELSYMDPIEDLIEASTWVNETCRTDF